MYIFLEENWTCSQQVGKLTLTGKKSRGFTPEMATRYEGRSGIHATASGCSGRVDVLEGADDTAPSSGSTAVSFKVNLTGNGSSSDSTQVLPIYAPEASFSLQDELQAETDENEVQISIAPPEKWADPDFMEDGEISGFEESDSDVVVTELPRWQQNSERDKRSYEEDQKLPNLKRQRLDNSVGESTRRQSSSPAKVSKSRIDYILAKSGSGPEQCSFNFSRLSGPNVSNHQQGLGGQDFSTDTSLEDLIASSLESESSQGDSFEDQFALVPLLRSIIEAQRKKTAELESENNLLKSLFAKSLSEKNETLEMLRKSNQTLKKVKNSSVVMADELKALKTQLAEKDAEIKNLRKDSFTIRDCVGSMGRTFLKIQEIENQAAGRGSGEEDPRTGDSQKHDSNKNGKGRNGTGMTVSDKAPRSPSKGNQDQVDQRGKRKTSPHPGKSSKSRRILTLEEMCIMNKLADLNKWKYSIRDIRWVDGEYVCPECGAEKKSLEAVAAHARDKHVWKHGANFGQNRDRRSD